MNPLQIMLVTSMQVLAIRWVDEADENGPVDMDIFFDRIVIIAAKLDLLKPTLPATMTQKGYFEKELIAPGVFITTRRVLTSYNPFRYIIPQKENLKNLFAIVLRKRTIVKPEHHTYDFINVTFSCAEQIIQISKDKLTKKQWHGFDKTHSPVHDLMVLRIDHEKLDFLDQEQMYSFDDYTAGIAKIAGPILTRFAYEGELLGRDVKFASLGFRSKRHIKKGNKLASRAYEEEENVVEDCEEWMPRYWGHFICIRNVDKYKGVGSGAILIHNNKLFGVGSFSLKKGNESILVFTDVRPYSRVIYNVCPVIMLLPSKDRRNSDSTDSTTTTVNDHIVEDLAERVFV